jgi:site-specific DNA-methyltransferase (adenine-specific)
MILTDPPYMINYHTSRRCDKTHDFCSPIDNDDNPELIEKTCYELNRILKEDSALYMFCSPDTVDLFKNEVKKHFKIKNIIVWDKGNTTAGDLEAAYGKQYEMIIYANKGRRLINGKRLNDIWYFPRVVGNEQFHQNQKPVSLIELMINKSSNENDIILDCFAGSGTTGVACENLNRNSILIEKEPDYCQIIRERMATTENLIMEARKQQTLQAYQGQQTLTNH